MHRITFLGTGDAMGVPRVYCDCSVCKESRGSGLNRRLRSSVWVEGEGQSFIVDCGPDWRSQMEMIGLRTIEHLLITHAHFDHIGGLPEWADACRWLGKKGQLYAPQEVIQTISDQFPWLPRNIDMHPIDSGVQLAGWNISAWKVNHGKNGYAYAYRFAKEGYTWAYCSDSIALTEEQKNPLHGLDLLVLGTSFYHEEAEFSTRSVYDMIEAFELLGEVKPTQAIFTHMSHDVDLNRTYPLPAHVQLAKTGMKISL
ncbi:MBL fold metallo-hydrolase [Paenibacillus sediminis]|uniref:Phosphoribosyl 1,2-cyclic phosphate phosphodiesterase n=1 Tax=Paenibacillus sediminis TaxID=664909 RepID=A0ABS4H4Z6_9BACL|nr:MBL fold metallo-hydrolase [Paenibacillus sediminis]MBP1937452.1 phosphoribosyl 1,2-cyclic phosphate phosphodiesterase [Paenibacillus sediminis]